MIMAVIGIVTTIEYLVCEANTYRSEYPPLLSNTAFPWRKCNTSTNGLLYPSLRKYLVLFLYQISIVEHRHGFSVPTKPSLKAGNALSWVYLRRRLLALNSIIGICAMKFPK